MKKGYFKKWLFDRNRKIEEELPSSFAMMANAMKAGLSLSQALQTVGEDPGSAFGEEIHGVLERVRLGAGLEDALLASAKKLRIPDYSLMVHSIVLFRAIGGNFVAHFEKLASILRERQRVTEKISLHTAQGLTQGLLLGCMPLALGLGLCFIAPGFLNPLWESPLGLLFSLLILLLDLGGYLWMRKMARVSV